MKSENKFAPSSSTADAILLNSEDKKQKKRRESDHCQSQSIDRKNSIIIPGFFYTWSGATQEGRDTYRCQNNDENLNVARKSTITVIREIDHSFDDF